MMNSLVSYFVSSLYYISSVVGELVTLATLGLELNKLKRRILLWDFEMTLGSLL